VNECLGSDHKFLGFPSNYASGVTLCLFETDSMFLSKHKSGEEFVKTQSYYFANLPQ